ncbi:MAG TPA: lipoprotein signal peptidase [Flavobacteriales bacterium]|jgi:signal peptidase II|nr:lipoprotein signal peptidase [Flavobacteriales bacterium]
MKRALLIILSVLVADQGLKIWVKTHMYLGQEIRFFDWFIIHFTENNGMAFGMEFAGEYGKLFLSVFRIFAVLGLAYFMYRMHKQGSPKGLVWSLALILAGALGNILDSAFYGLVFNDSYHQISSLFPAEGGYAPFLYGRVVDMLYFPLISGFFPDWFPVWGGEYFLFFRPVFNIADSAISFGVGFIAIFQRSFFADPKKVEAEKEEADSEVKATDSNES